jgi:LacI family transcriptional regulator
VTLEVINVRDRMITEGRVVVRALARRPPGEMPDGIFAVDDLLALGLLQALVVDHGVRVPAEVALVGYDDIEFGESSIIPLTSERAPHEEFGIAAVDRLIDELSDAPTDVPKHVVSRRTSWCTPRPSTTARGLTALLEGRTVALQLNRFKAVGLHDFTRR